MGKAEMSEDPATLGTVLTTQEREILHFEDTHPRHTGQKELAIRVQLGLAPAVYYSRLNVLLNDPDAEAAHPMLVHRLRRLQEQRTRRRQERRRTRALGA
jgi:hypothetical protein